MNEQRCGNLLETAPEVSSQAPAAPFNGGGGEDDDSDSMSFSNVIAAAESTEDALLPSKSTSVNSLSTRPLSSQTSGSNGTGKKPRSRKRGRNMSSEDLYHLSNSLQLLQGIVEGDKQVLNPFMDRHDFLLQGSSTTRKQKNKKGTDGKATQSFASGTPTQVISQPGIPSATREPAKKKKKTRKRKPEDQCLHSSNEDEDDLPLAVYYTEHLKASKDTQKVLIGDDVPLSDLAFINAATKATRRARKPQSKIAATTPAASSPLLRTSPLLLPITPCPPQQSCLFVEVPPQGTADSEPLDGRSEKLRQLLVEWSSLVNSSFAAASAQDENAKGKRLIVFVLHRIDAVRPLLMSWVQRSYVENALILPLFAVCCSRLASSLSASPVSQQSRLGVIISHVCRAFCINPDASVGVYTTAVGKQAMQDALLPQAQIMSGVSACAALLSSWRRVDGAGRHEGGGASSNALFYSVPTVVTPPSPSVCVEMLSESVFDQLCRWNGLARALALRPRRPAVILHHVNTTAVHHPHSLLSLQDQKQRPLGLLYGLVRPAANQACVFAPASSREGRVLAARPPRIMFSPHCQSRLYQYLTRFFTPDVWTTAVNVVRFSGNDYLSGYMCASQGYMKYQVSCFVRTYVRVSAVVNFLPLVMASLEVGDAWESFMADESVMLSALDCTCTPRSFERVLYTDKGEKKCRHVAQLAYYFLCHQLSLPEPQGEKSGSAGRVAATAASVSFVSSKTVSSPVDSSRSHTRKSKSKVPSLTELSFQLAA